MATEEEKAAVKRYVRMLIDHQFEGVIASCAAAADVSATALSDVLSGKRNAGRMVLSKLGELTGDSPDTIRRGLRPLPVRRGEQIAKALQEALAYRAERTEGDPLTVRSLAWQVSLPLQEVEPLFKGSYLRRLHVLHAVTRALHIIIFRQHNTFWWTPAEAARRDPFEGKERPPDWDRHPTMLFSPEAPPFGPDPEADGGPAAPAPEHAATTAAEGARSTVPRTVFSVAEIAEHLDDQMPASIAKLARELLEADPVFHLAAQLVQKPNDKQLALRFLAALMIREDEERVRRPEADAFERRAREVAARMPGASRSEVLAEVLTEEDSEREGR